MTDARSFRLLPIILLQASFPASCRWKMRLPPVRFASVMSLPHGLTLCTMLTAAACVCFNLAVSLTPGLGLFLPAGPTACLGTIGASCTLTQQPEPLNDSCARTNYAQLASSISAADQSKARQTSLSLHKPRRFFHILHGACYRSPCSAQ